MPTYLRWCEKMWVLSACLASMWHGKCYLERKYLILYYYQDDNCNRIIHGRVFVQDPTLFTGLFTTQSQKSEYPPPPSSDPAVAAADVAVSERCPGWWFLLTVGSGRHVYPIITHSIHWLHPTGHPANPTVGAVTMEMFIWPPPPATTPPPHIHTHPSHPLNHIFSSTTRLSLESFTWAVWWWPSANASYHQQQAHNKW